MPGVLQESPKILGPMLKAYEDRLDRCGPNAQGVFWKNQEWQHRRYATLERVFDQAAQKGGITIHDFGCGYGALFEYLSKKPMMTNSHYIGTDLSQNMIKAARSRNHNPRASFIHGCAATKIVDFTIVSGTYNMHINADPEEWTFYVKTSLEQLWRHTSRGLAFNLLSHQAKKKYGGLYYADPKVFLKFVKKTLSSNYEIVYDPPLPDFTIFVRST